MYGSPPFIKFSEKYKWNVRTVRGTMGSGKFEFGGEINELYQTMIFYTADRLAEVDNKNYLQLRNNVLV